MPRPNEIGGGEPTSKNQNTYNRGTYEIDPERAMRDIYARQLNNFNTNQAPAIDELQDSLNDRSITERSQVEANRLRANTEGMNKRLMSGRDTGLLPSQVEAQSKRMDNSVAKAQGSLLTTAKRTERSNRVATRLNLMSIGEQLAANGTASMSTIMGEKNARDARNKAASSSKLTGVLAMAGTVIGGIYGGPAGAAAGGAIGGTVGSNLG
jgi:hypothetical protein